APSDAELAVIRTSAGIPGLVDAFKGYDLVLYANLTGHTFTDPELGAGTIGFETALLDNGFANNPQFGGSGAVLLNAQGGHAQLGAHQVFAMLVPTAAQGFTASATEGNITLQG